MSFDTLAQTLARLGIAHDQIALVALLPLVRVAWADGQVHEQERAFVLDVAERHGLVGPDTRATVEGWLDDAPSGFFLDSADQLLTRLRARAFPDGLTARDLVEECIALAGVAGGVFGTSWRAVSAEERLAIEEVANVLGVRHLSVLAVVPAEPAPG